MTREQIIAEVFEVFIRIWRDTFKAKIWRVWRIFTAEEVDEIISEYREIFANKKSA